MVMFNWQEVEMREREEWRCAGRGTGSSCAMIDGLTERLKSCADNLTSGTPAQVF